MEPAKVDEETSDDEIHFGEFTLKQIRKKLGIHHVPNKICDSSIKNEPNNDVSLRLIETCSLPNLRLKAEDSSSISETPPGLNSSSDSADSFIQMENMVTKLCLSPRKSESVELNNTLDVVDYVLKYGPQHNHSPNAEIKEEIVDNTSLKMGSPLKLNSSSEALEKTVKNESDSPNNTQQLNTPAKSVRMQQIKYSVTPSSSGLKAKTTIFKTPAKPSTLRKPTTPSRLLTPRGVTSYQHIKSPIALYINNCPTVPLVKDVHPKKPLPGSSSIPKFIRQPSATKIIQKNKENVDLPSVAYKHAKKTQVINLPDDEKLPKNQWIKKITSTNPKPTVMKHDRARNPIKKLLLLNQEDSFENLPCHQSEVSLCTEKTAFKNTNK